MHKTVKCNLQIFQKTFIKHTNILHVFNLTLLINVFAADLQLSNSTIIIKNYFRLDLKIRVLNFLLLYPIVCLLYRSKYAFPSAWLIHFSFGVRGP